MSWKPTASFEVLRLRASIIAELRKFFAERNILEVETPLLYGSTATDLQLTSFTSRCLQRLLFLQTSPEFPMKRLLAAGSGPIYQITKAFREGESGRLHNPEFTMLEWYRPGFSLEQFMDEMQALLFCILSNKKPEHVAYADIFQTFLNINPHTASLEVLMNCAENQGLVVDGLDSDRDAYLDLLMSHCIEPNLGWDCPIFIDDFPASQASLAKIYKKCSSPLEGEGDPKGRMGGDILLAQRFELYIDGMEIANAYYELTDPSEQQLRFESDNKKRKKLGLPVIPVDRHLLAALEQGLPESSGAALGVDRLVFLAAKRAGYKVESINDVLSFPVDCV